MKKIVSITLSFLLILSLSSFISANGNLVALTTEDIEKSGFSQEIKDMISQKIENGEVVYRGTGTTAPDYLNKSIKTRSISSDVIRLPSNSATFDFDMEYGNTYYSQFTFKATTNCSMNIYRNCGYNGTPCRINLQVVEVDGATIFNENVTVNQTGTTLSIGISSGKEYYIQITPLDIGETYASFYVYGS